MKKHLLTTALVALMGFSATYAQDTPIVVYAQGDKVTSIDDLTTGIYFIRAHACSDKGKVNTMDRGEYMMRDNSIADDAQTWTDNPYYAAEMSTTYDLGNGTTPDPTMVWKLVVTDEVAPEDWGSYGDGATFSGKVFTVQNLSTGRFFSFIGRNGTEQYPAKNPSRATSDESKIGRFQLVNFEAPEGGYLGKQTESHRFFIQLINAKFNNSGNIAYPFFHSNNATPARLSFWKGASTSASTSVEFDLVKAVELTVVPVTVKLPAINGIAIPDQQVNMPLGKSPESSVLEVISGLNNGDFTITGCTDENGNPITTVTEETHVINVQGQWERGIVPGQVFRLRVRANDAARGAMRYMISTGKIETNRESAEETLNRLVPERLWYFTVSDDGKYQIHTLYDPTQAIKFTKTGNDWSGAIASLSNEGTDLEIDFRNNGFFYFKISGETDAWINEYQGKGTLSIWHSSNGANDNGGIMRIYPLTEDDFGILSDFCTPEEIAAAKADPTVENVKPLIDAYNANNAEAALKRTEYILNSGIGYNPGQYVDKDGIFAETVEKLRQLSNDPDADAEELQATIDAINSMVADIDSQTLIFNEMTPGFYRFRSKVNSTRYLSALYGGKAASKDAMAMTEDNTRSNTVFYVEDKGTPEEDGTINYTVYCYENGLVLPNLTGNSWMPALSDAATASSNVQFSYQNDGCYVIHVGYDKDAEGNEVKAKHRHLHGGDKGSGNANAGGDKGDGYRWHIERVTDLPVTFYNVMGIDGYDDDGWTTIYSPVALEVPEAYKYTTAYTGNFDDTKYADGDIHHVLATKIEPNEEGKVIIPANQPALLYYDGTLSPKENDNIDESLMENRSEITYLTLPIVFNHESTEEVKGNLSASFHATPNEEGTDYFTLHASHSNNFREYSKYTQTTAYEYVPGFKAHIQTPHDDVESFYPICLVNPNTMVPLQGDEDYKVSKDEQGNITVTVTTPDENYEVYYKQLTTKGKSAVAPMRRAATVDHTGYDRAEKSGSVHTMTVADGNIEYYAYHLPSKLKGAVRTATVDTTGIDEITAEGEAAKVYDLQGRKLAAPAKGINIVNGKKVLVK